MLVNLHVRNMALIEEADIDLTGGLTILTGETGADRVKIRFTKTAISAVEKLNMDKADKK